MAVPQIEDTHRLRGENSSRTRAPQPSRPRTISARTSYSQSNAFAFSVAVQKKNQHRTQLPRSVVASAPLNISSHRRANTRQVTRRVGQSVVKSQVSELATRLDRVNLKVGAQQYGRTVTAKLKPETMPAVHRVYGPEEKFREISVFPQSQDVLRKNHPVLKPNLVWEPYNNRNHYLDVQFRLLREDMIRPLREAIWEFSCEGQKLRPEKSSAKIYHSVRISFATPCFSGMRRKVYLSREQAEKIPWRNSKRLMEGNLVCLSSDNFSSRVIFGIVSKSDPQSLAGGYLYVEFVKDDTTYGSDVDTTTVYTMIESEAYFEAYRHVLSGLKETEHIPLEEHIVLCRDDVSESTRYNFSEIVESKLKTKKWSHTSTNVFPDPEQVGLNYYQHWAWKHALTSKLAIIQGPPGTGKTHVGLKIVRTLLANRKSNPILVVCFTNHALDQFLEGISKFHPKGIVRIGGQCKNKSLEKYKLRNVCTKNRQISWRWARLCEMEEEIENQLEPLENSGNFIWRVSDLWEVITETNPQASFFFSKEPDKMLMNWLDLLPALSDLDVEDDMDLGGVDGSEDFQVMDEAQIAREMREVETWQTGRRKKSSKGKGLDSFNFGGKVSKGAKKKILQMIELQLNKNSAMSEEEATSVANITVLPLSERWRLYKFWVQKRCAQCQSYVDSKVSEYLELVAEVKQLQDEDTLSTCSGADIVGLTTTGAAKFRKVIQQLPVKTVIIEEAAEVLEAHIVTSMPLSTEHLILIGDHQQLKPSPTVYKLAIEHKLDVSMFERLIEMKLPYVTLRIQHRMRPEIADLLRLDIYDHLDDHESVQKYETIKGVTKNVFFISHNHRESSMPGGKSKANNHEASFLSSLCKYFLDQGYDAEKITVLTAYTGQLLAFKKFMNKSVHSGVKVTTVDNFQGEENDIILLSLVRSNEEVFADSRIAPDLGHSNLMKGPRKIQGAIDVTKWHTFPKNTTIKLCIFNEKIGFLGIENRVCVAMSRAKKGLFCIGDFEMLQKKSRLWRNIAQHLQNASMIGKSLLLRCENHPENCVEATKSADFQNVPEGGCMQKCNSILPCGHFCTRYCHPSDREHQKFKCEKLLQKYCDNEVERHIVRRRCCEKKWPQCRKLVMKTLPSCGHQKEMACFENPVETKCEKECEKTLECGHNCPNKCGDSCAMKCRKPTKLDLPCGHKTVVTCSTSRRLTGKGAGKQNDLEWPKCMMTVKKTLPSCGHQKEIACFENPVETKCEKECEKTLECGHNCPNKCGDSCATKCRKPTKLARPCGHTMYVACSDSKRLSRISYSERKGLKWPKCEKIVEKTLPSCGHTKEMACDEDPQEAKCEKACEKTLECGHKCTKKCKDACTTKCTKPTKISRPCGHTMFVTCSQNRRLSLISYSEWKNVKWPECKEVVEKVLPTCGHTIRAYCYQKHVAEPKCSHRCEEKMNCGHQCPNKCGEDCADPNSCTVHTIQKRLCGHLSYVACNTAHAKKSTKCSNCLNKEKGATESRSADHSSV